MSGYWMNEGGQSSTGQVGETDVESSLLRAHDLTQLIEFITTTHPAYTGLLKIAEKENSSPHEGPHTASVILDDLQSA
jgi:ribulose kinase